MGVLGQMYASTYEKIVDPKEIKSLVKLMRSQGITSLKTQAIELVLNPEAPVKRRRTSKSAVSEPLPKDKGFKGYSEEELLMWSSAPIGGEDAEDNEI